MRGRNGAQGASGDDGRGPTAARVCLLAWAGAVTALGCEPIIDVEGAFFPGWLLCLLLGVFGAVAARYLFVWLRIERYVEPGWLIYTALATLLALASWMLLFHS